MLAKKSEGFFIKGFVKIQDDCSLKEVGARILGDWQDLPQLIRDHEVEDIILCTETGENEQITAIIDCVQNEDIHLKIMPDQYSLVLGMVKMNNILGAMLVEVDFEVMPTWQKWTQPYVKNVQLYFNTSRGNVNAPTPSCPSGSWSQCGQVTGSYLLNTSLTGQLNTWNRAPGSATMFRNSWLGGSMTALPNTAAAGILMESGNLQIGVVPIAYGTDASSNSVTVFPPAVREYWTWELGLQAANYSGLRNAQADENRAAFQGVIVGHADGSAKYYQLGKFLANTPTALEYGVNVNPAFGMNLNNGTLRGFTGGTVGLGANPNLMVQYPLWGLGQ